MGIKRSEKFGGLGISISKRDPKTKKVHSLRRYRNAKGEPIKSMAEARRIEREMWIQLERKISSRKGSTWIDACNVTFEAMRDEGIKEKTIKNYKLCLSAHTFEIWNGKLLSEVTANDIRDLVLVRMSNHSSSSQKNMLKFIRKVFNVSISKGLTSNNPVPDLRPERSKFKVRKVLSEEQAKKVLTQAKNTGWEWYPHVAMAIYTGMRNGELYSLTWDKVNLNLRQILVNESWNKEDGFKETKSGDDRIVEIAKPLIPLLKQLKLKNTDGDFVLPRLRKWDKGEQARELRMFLMGMGLPVIRFHDLRATWATIMLSKGIEPFKVMAMGGWKDLKTMEIYCRKAGVTIKGITDVLDLHDPSEKTAQVFSISQK